jgi:hypothetical protein
MTTGGEGGRRFAADLEQDLARLLAWGASPPSCSRSAHPAWGASRGALFHPEGERKREREGSFFFRFKESFTVLRERGRERKKTSRPLPFLFRERKKPSTSRFAVLKERGGGRRKGPRGSCYASSGEPLTSWWI